MKNWIDITIEYHYGLLFGKEKGCVFGLILTKCAIILNNRNRFKAFVFDGMREHTWSGKSLVLGQLCEEFLGVILKKLE